LTLTGSGFLTNSVVQINGSNRPTAYVSGLKLTSTIFASDTVTPSTLLVTVFNPFAAGGGLTSNGLPLAVSSAPSPSLISASPGFTSQGADHVRMTLVGANFRPGATVVVSPPVAALSNSNGHTRATDVAVLSVAVVNSGLMTALVTFSPRAIPGLRAVDVLNLDGTSTAGSFVAAGGTSQPVEVQSSNSLGAPVAVLNMALTHPARFDFGWAGQLTVTFPTPAIAVTGWGGSSAWKSGWKIRIDVPALRRPNASTLKTRYVNISFPGALRSRTSGIFGSQRNPGITGLAVTAAADWPPPSRSIA
jgi:hypothetical protein